MARMTLAQGWDFLTDLKWQAKLFAYDAQYGVSDGYLTIKEAEKANKEFHEIMEKWIPKIEAEICLLETEMDDSPEIKEYDSIMNGNAFRKSRNRKAQQNGKRNAKKAKRLHDSDRKHGKPIPQSDKKYWDEQSGTFYRWDEKRKTFDSHKKPVIHRKRKTFRNRLESAAKEREIDFLSAIEICDRSNTIFFQAEKETNPIRQKQLKDIAYELLCAGCVDFNYNTITGHKGTYFPHLAIGENRKV